MDPRLASLNDVLADLYPTVEEARRIVSRAGLRPSLIAFHAAALVNWYNILEAGRRAHKVEALVQAALQDFGDNLLLRNLADPDAQPLKGPDIQRDVVWRTGPEGDRLEKVMGARSTLLPIAFLEEGVRCARAVARVVLGDGSSGSGFVIGQNWLLTNHHVLPSAAQAAGARAEFNYQQLASGADAPIRSFTLSPADGFATSRADDWSAVRIEGHAAEEFGSLILRAAEVAPDDFVNIIQHPGGGPKQIAMYHNTVTYADQTRVQYLTDTLPGSSGSPVFDSTWSVVALHHSGGLLREPGTKRVVYRNEGIHVNTIIDGLRAMKIDIPER